MKRSALLQSARVLGVMVAGLLAAASAVALEPPQPRLDYQVEEGLNSNHFLRQGEVAAHLVLRSGTDPRIIIAFPAGNSGVGVWFDHLPDKATWTPATKAEPAHDVDSRGRALYGLSAQVSIAAPHLRIRQAVLSSVRVLRDYQSLGTVLPEVVVAPHVEGRTISWSRDRLDGAAGYRLVLELIDGQVSDRELSAGADGRITLRITGLTGEMPLTPLSGSELLSAAAAPDTAARRTLTFLAYHEKLNAGSWRFNTYFGRDTLISVRLLMPALSATAIDAALDSVLARLSARGEVAHEEDIGERAVLDHMQTDGSRSAAPVFDYKMIDGNYLLGPVVSAWLVRDERGRSRAAAFLAASVGEVAGSRSQGRSRGAALIENFRLVLQSASAFATDPGSAHLIGLKPGFAVGNWRDSETGLGGGRYAYDVNAVLVPAALEAVARLYDNGLLAPYVGTADRPLFAEAAHMAQVWRARAPPLFDVSLSHDAAVAAIKAYAASISVPAEPAVAALAEGELHFHALALEADGRPVPVMHSDEGFALLFAEPDAARVDGDVSVLMRPFPAGLMTGVGMLVANPAFSTPALQALFTRNAYHGTVVWSWQQALFAAGLERQLRRQDLTPAVRAHLSGAQKVLWSAIEATRSMKNSELWSWSFAADRYRVAPFGAAAADVDESDAAQLWSTAYLALRPPRAAVAAHPARPLAAGRPALAEEVARNESY
ncbi:MAG TPA: hypothetical protein VKB72_01925 [Steroidobacteraceae bacterium]|nr:hypothetical protein [Steroidobacteraceae bacterium]